MASSVLTASGTAAAASTSTMVLRPAWSAPALTTTCGADDPHCQTTATGDTSGTADLVAGLTDAAAGTGGSSAVEFTVPVALPQPTPYVRYEITFHTNALEQSSQAPDLGAAVYAPYLIGDSSCAGAGASCQRGELTTGGDTTLSLQEYEPDALLSGTRTLRVAARAYAQAEDDRARTTEPTCTWAFGPCVSVATGDASTTTERVHANITLTKVVVTYDTPSVGRPQSFTASTVGAVAKLSWQPPVSYPTAVASYNIYQEGTLVGQTTGTSFEYPAGDRPSDFWVAGVLKGSEGARAGVLVPARCPDTAPSGFHATRSDATTVQLSWDAMDVPWHQGYEVTRTSALTATDFDRFIGYPYTTWASDSRAPSGVTYRYTVRAVGFGTCDPAPAATLTVQS